jgi:hypothetical protein
MQYILLSIQSKNPDCAVDVQKRLEDTFLRKYEHISSVRYDTLRQAYSFLIRIGLVTATPVHEDFHCPVTVLDELENPDSTEYETREALFEKVNFTINYPPFYVEILKEVFGEFLPDDLGRNTLGAVVECNIRGLLPRSGQYEYHDKGDHEIDYISPQEGIAIEMSVRDKRPKDIYFGIIPKEKHYHNVLLGRRREKWRDIIEIPYYEFIYGISVDRGKYLQDIRILDDVPGLPAYEIPGEPDEPAPCSGRGDYGEN